MDLKVQYPLKKGKKYEASDGKRFDTYEAAQNHQVPINQAADISDPYRMLGDQSQKLRP
ncbi:hypothetical protein [Neorhizobium sp. AL 9.2.2]|uniref:hypothetical protein n=1 Tax=Neorhizobium sp. AL 9.2.2 TaxID=2712894 RepID=UPI0015730D2C|nr:hypothetical protein [Neorhizobium sp. AL 9.2.2]NSY17274.1 hypothetical protein [Neorhizobium sp. AL 9.2.2]